LEQESLCILKDKEKMKLYEKPFYVDMAGSLDLGEGPIQFQAESFLSKDDEAALEPFRNIRVSEMLKQCRSPVAREFKVDLPVRGGQK
jgi:hypothetical protein